MFGHHRHLMVELDRGLGRWLRTEQLGRLLKVDGATPPDHRQAMARQFAGQPDCRLFLLSMTCGGVGLNLQAASTVVFVELPTNAGVYAQCVGRAHRQGQAVEVCCHFLRSNAHPCDAQAWRAMGNGRQRTAATLDGARPGRPAPVARRALAPAAAAVGLAAPPFHKERHRIFQ